MDNDVKERVALARTCAILPSGGSDMARKNIWSMTDKGIEYNLEYKRNMMLSVGFRLHRKSDADLIEVYQSIPDKSEWFRECLREYKNKTGN